MKDGRKCYRVTHLVRLPRCHIGDIIQLNGVLFQVTDFKTQIQVSNLATGDDQAFSYEKIDTAEVLSLPIKTAIVLSESEKEVQLMDPDTYKTIEVIKPQGYRGGSKEVQIITWGTRVYLLPQG